MCLIVKKAGGKVFGAHLTSAEKKALDLEVRRETVRINDLYMADLDATVLYYVHTRYGFHKKRLRDFYIGFREFYNKLVEYYVMEQHEGAWVCRLKLKELGIDIDELRKEIGG